MAHSTGHVANAGLNTGSMLFRNSDWSRRLLADLCAYAARAHSEDLLMVGTCALCAKSELDMLRDVLLLPVSMFILFSRCYEVSRAIAQELRQHVELVQGFHDTPLLYLVLKRTPGNLDRVYFEGDVGRVTIGLNRHFAQVSGKVLAT